MGFQQSVNEGLRGASMVNVVNKVFDLKGAQEAASKAYTKYDDDARTADANVQKISSEVFTTDEKGIGTLNLDKANELREAEANRDIANASRKSAKTRVDILSMAEKNKDLYSLVEKGDWENAEKLYTGLTNPGRFFARYGYQYDAGVQANQGAKKQVDSRAIQEENFKRMADKLRKSGEIKMANREFDKKLTKEVEQAYGTKRT